MSWLIENGFELDPGAAFELVRAVYASTEAFADDFDLAYPSPGAFRRHIEALRQRPGNLFLVARQREALAGFLVVAPRPQARLRHTADLTMGLLAEARGRGVGRDLLDAALARLRQAGTIEIVYLMVRADNRPALKLYETRGFQGLATLVGDTRIGEQHHDGVLMSLHLPGRG